MKLSPRGGFAHPNVIAEELLHTKQMYPINGGKVSSLIIEILNTIYLIPNAKFSVELGK